MRVRRYVADTVGEAMAQVKAELGSDAVILHSRTIRQGGFLGFFGRKVIEVTAALEDEVIPAQPLPTLPSSGRDRRWEAQSAYRNTATTPREIPSTGYTSTGSSLTPRDEEPYTPQHLSDFLDRFKDHLGSEEVVSPRGGLTMQRNQSPTEAALASQTLPAREALPVSEVRQPLYTEADLEEDQLAEIRKELQQTQALLRQVVEIRDDEKGTLANEMPRHARRLWKQLVSNDMDADLATELINGVLAEYQADNEAELEEALTRRVRELMQDACVGEPELRRPEIIALVGPTGVGKTTTLAKLAANMALVEKKKVGLITIDTYRIAAVEQLKTYAKILDLQVHVVFTPQELPRVLAQMSDCDIIFLDTAGRSHKNAMQMSELKAFFDAGQPTRAYLVLSLTTKFSDMMEIIAQYEPLRLDTLIFTKLDETTSFGNLFNIAILLQKQIAFLTDGQSVPEDINPADPQQLTNLIMGKKSHA